MNLARAVLPALLALALACDGSTPAASGPRVVETSPAADATAVPVLSNVTLTLSTGIDLDSLTAASVQLSRPNRSGPDVVPAALGWEASTRTITVDPHGALEHATRYTVRVHGLRAADGAAIADATFSFRTTVNPEVRWAVPEGDGLAGYTAYDVDALGRVTRAVTYGSAGADGRWVTPDDVVEGYWTRTDLARGEASWLGFDDPGADGAWFTADDRVAFRSSSWFDTDGAVTALQSYAGPGPDGRWGTSDDAVRSRVATVLNAAGDLEHELSFSAPGADGAWGTGDDVVQGDWAYRTDAAGRATRVVYADDPGPDGVWFTADDRVRSYTDHDFDAADAEVGSRTFTNPGPDAVWFTADDGQGSAHAITRDADGLARSEVTYVGPGSDGLWGTSDDTIAWWAETRYDARGERVGLANHQDPGPDGAWFTADDALSGEAVFDATR